MPPKRLSLRSSRPILTVLFWLSASGSALAQQPAAPYCRLEMILELTPDVPNVRDPGFVSSLLSSQGGFHLYLQHVVDDTHLDMLILGPGARRDCRAAIEAMRKDARVKSIQVQ
jgi:hypothetical protein